MNKKPQPLGQGGHSYSSTSSLLYGVGGGVVPAARDRQGLADKGPGNSLL